MLQISLLAGAIGVGAGLVAFALYRLIALISNLVFLGRVDWTLPVLHPNPLGLWVLVVPAIGGLLVGVMAKYGSDMIRGHGIPEAMEAVLINRSRIAPRVAVLKPLSAAIAIGTGGPFGAEGPIIQTGGALGSLVGQFLHTTAAERKVLLACGAAAGMAATFSTPIAAVIIAIELLLFEFRSRSFIPLVIASTLATAVHFALLGRGPLFTVAPVDFGIPTALGYYVLLGVLCGLAAVVMTRAFYWVEDQFERLPVDALWWPAIGGLILGAIGYVFPRVLGVGYDVISDILNDRLTLLVLLSIVVFKSLALFVSLGSGTSGGLLAPMLMAGAALGGLFAHTVNVLVPGAGLAPGAFALAGMAAVFGAASRATFAFIIFAFEITRDYNAVLPLMLTGVIADGIALVLMRNSIMTEKLARRGLKVYGDYEADILRQVTVAEVMNTAPNTAAADMPARDLAERMANGNTALPLLDAEGRLAGIVTRGDVLRLLTRDPDAGDTALDAGTRTPVVTFPDETLDDAVQRMQQHNVGRLPVVHRDAPTTLIGYLSREEVLHARLRRLTEEQVFEPGWIRRAAAVMGRRPPPA